MHAVRRRLPVAVSIPVGVGMRRQRGRLVATLAGGLGTDEVRHRVDEREMGECLREVAQVPPRGRLDLLAVEAQVAGQRDELLAQ